MIRLTNSCLAAFLLICSTADAQDTGSFVRSARNMDLRVDLAGGWYKQNHVVDEEGISRVYIPAGLSRRRHDPGIRNAWNLANDHRTDDPLSHGCVYLDINLQARIGKELVLTGDIVGEHRGFSGGLYNTSNLVVYPKMQAVYQRSFSVLKQEFRAGFSGGFRDSLRQLEGLTIYNMDLDNASLYLQWKHFRITAGAIGDLIYTGLRIDDQVSAVASLEALRLPAGWKADVKLAGIVNTGYNAYAHADLSAGFYLPGRLRLYGQISRRLNGIKSSSPMAGLVGGNFRYTDRRFSVKGFLEGRYYGAAYNRGYIYEEVYFRPQRDLKAATDFVGTHLYPLMLYDRPYSKWAVYTEYQGRHVTAFNAWADARCKLFDRFYAHVQIDLNLIRATGLDAIWLPFYKAGFGYEILQDNFFQLSWTNKSMNLDKHYPDFYLLDQYSVLLQFTRNLSRDAPHAPTL